MRTTRRKGDVVHTPLSMGRGGERYQGIGSSDSQMEEDGLRGGTIPSSSPATDSFSDRTPVLDLWGNSRGDTHAKSSNAAVSSTGSVLPQGVGTGKKISINLKGIRGANSSTTVPSRSHEDGIDDFLSIAARSDHQSSPGAASDEVDEIIF